MKVRVHGFKRRYASSHDVQFVPDYNMTEEDIRLDQSIIIPGTAQVVDADALDRLGRFYPPSR